MNQLLTADERETAFVQSAADRQRGVWQVFSCDPYWMRRLERYGKLLRTDGTGAWYEIEHRQITLRKPLRMLKLPASEGFEVNVGHVTETV